MSELVDQALCNILSKKIGEEWRCFGQALHVEDVKLDNIKHKFQDINIRAFKCLMSWKEQQTKPSIENLKNQFVNQGKQLWADKVESCLAGSLSV